ncbi:branched-chain amino acid ABC transporter permease [Hydrogenophaga sp. OTU3427]|uniref:branched-chain amino acid ABC transporter permease n=1 Tax=Hydrogenophaga sp. OTU3427 TaxID=3043856 RepID=UPI00313B7D5D
MSLLDVLFSGQLLFAALLTGSIYALVALGLNLVYGTMRMLNVAHGDVVMLGAYAAFWAYSLLGVSPLLALPMVALMGALAGYVTYKLLFKRLLSGRQGAASRMEGNSLLLFFGLSIVIQNAVALLYSPNSQAYTYLDQIVRLGDVAMTGNRLLALVVAAGACLVVAVFLGFSATGLSMRALIERREAAYVVGVDVNRVQWLSFALGFGSAALAGVLVSMLEQFSPFVGFPLTIAGFIVIILGGLGNLMAGLVAALLLGAIETYGVALTSATFRSVLLYGVFVLALLLFPNGLLSRSAFSRK